VTVLIESEPVPYDPSQGYVLFDGTNRACPLCGDQVIDPTTQCCVGDVAVQKHPIADLSQCPNRIADPSHVPGFNGCGPAFLTGVQFLIPQGYGSASFTNSCNGHDICYDTCNSDKNSCDLNLGISMVQSCTETYQPIISTEDDPALQQIFNAQYTYCKIAAFQFYNAVHLLGQGAFDSAQEDACDCCP
jgi:Group XII secretory phospholipase A2 precursor (PLA2G12)